MEVTSNTYFRRPTEVTSNTYFHGVLCPSVDGDSQRPPSRLAKAAPPALTLNQENNPPDVNLLTEFAVIATGPQSPLVQNAPDDKYCPPNLVDSERAVNKPPCSFFVL